MISWDLEESSNNSSIFEYIRVYSSIFEYIGGILLSDMKLTYSNISTFDRVVNQAAAFIVKCWNIVGRKLKINNFNRGVLHGVELFIGYLVFCGYI